ncbi:MAG: mechanosensitive ion channel family protein [Tessaracoccus sp.]|uniref:mechanosensitive ion channel family protein n=1 Tax=Tessaracoccus sp. TaxID=1971211 RepID=UPI001EC9628F|nr:mechanosensitive ion channel family protein [Tessaracoccus sp.]MBK7822293.1 mechanosensitive ion channel family protein [Tessaracoccus sp.]
MNDIWQNLALSGVVVVVAAVLRAVLRFAIRRTVRVLTTRDHQTNEDLGAKARRVLEKASGAASARHRQRVETLGSLLRNIVDVVLVVLVLLTILAIFGVPMGPLVASAGVGGVALGFGAQSLVKDYLSGIFMLTEDQFGVGDLVQIGVLTGTVQEVTLRVTRLRDPSGTIWYVRNGEVLTLGNVSQGFSTSVIDIPIAVGEDPEKAKEVLRAALAPMAEEQGWAEVLLEAPEVLGVGAVTATEITIQIRLRTGPNEQAAPTRAVRERAVLALASAGFGSAG